MNQYYQKLPDRSLTTKDINGAQSRQLHFAMNRNVQPYQEDKLMFQYNNLTFYNRPARINNQEQNQNIGRRKYQNDMLNYQPDSIIPQNGKQMIQKGRKHFQLVDGEVSYQDKQQETLLYENFNKNQIQSINQNDFDRALQTNDIEGAVPGTLISKVLKNKQAAQKRREEQQSNKEKDSRYSGCKNEQNSYFHNMGQSVLNQNKGYGVNDRMQYYQQVRKDPLINRNARSSEQQMNQKYNLGYMDQQQQQQQNIYVQDQYKQNQDSYANQQTLQDQEYERLKQRELEYLKLRQEFEQRYQDQQKQQAYQQNPNFEDDDYYQQQEIQQQQPQYSHQQQQQAQQQTPQQLQQYQQRQQYYNQQQQKKENPQQMDFIKAQKIDANFIKQYHNNSRPRPF